MPVSVVSQGPQDDVMNQDTMSLGFPKFLELLQQIQCSNNGYMGHR